METSGLLLVSAFCNMQRTLLIEGKDTNFSKSRIAYKEKTMEIRTFYVKLHA